MTETGTFRCWLPFPPTANNIFAHGVVKGRVRRFPTKTYKAWQNYAGLLVNTARAQQLRGYFQVPVVVTIALKPPNRTRRDADNYVKPVLDLLVKGRVLVDDSNSYVLATTAYWDPENRRPGATVFIRPARVAAQPKQLSLGLSA